MGLPGQQSLPVALDVDRAHDSGHSRPEWLIFLALLRRAQVYQFLGLGQGHAPHDAGPLKPRAQGVGHVREPGGFRDVDRMVRQDSGDDDPGFIRVPHGPRQVHHPLAHAEVESVDLVIQRRDHMVALAEIVELGARRAIQHAGILAAECRDFELDTERQSEYRGVAKQQLARHPGDDVGLVEAESSHRAVAVARDFFLPTPVVAAVDQRTHAGLGEPSIA